MVRIMLEVYNSVQQSSKNKLLYVNWTSQNGANLNIGANVLQLKAKNYAEGR